MPSYQYNASIPSQTSVSLPNSPKIMAPAQVRHTPVHSISSPKGSPLRRPSNSNHGSPKRQVVEEQWIDGPRLSKFKVAEARHLMREINHVKKCETWIDGPNMGAKMSPSKSIAVGGSPSASCTQTYGYMDNHKKIMIRQWVENQTNQVFNANTSSPTVSAQSRVLPMPVAKNTSDDEEICIETTLNEITESLCGSKEANHTMDISIRMTGAKSNQEVDGGEHLDIRSMKSATSSHRQNDSQEDEDQDSGPSEVPPALPLIEPLSSREISHDSIHLMCSRHVSRENLGLNIQTIDCGLQVTEEEIAREMGRYVCWPFWNLQFFLLFSVHKAPIIQHNSHVLFLFFVHASVTILCLLWAMLTCQLSPVSMRAESEMHSVIAWLVNIRGIFEAHLTLLRH